MQKQGNSGQVCRGRVLLVKFAEAGPCWTSVLRQGIALQMRRSRISMASVQKLVTDGCVDKQDITGQVSRSRVMLGTCADEGYRSARVQKQSFAGQVCKR